jgi:hypothetical protein
VAPSELSERIAAVLAIDRSAPAIEFGARWRTWGELAATSSPSRPGSRSRARGSA